MMTKKWLLLLPLVALALLPMAAGSALMQDIASPTPTLEADHQYPHEDYRIISHNLAGVQVAIQKPKGWDAFITDYGIVLVEGHNPLSATDSMEGLSIYIFVPPLQHLNGFVLPVTMADINPNLALEVLRYVRQRPEYVADAVVSEPVAFLWQEQDAAYYLLTSADDNITMLLAWELAGNSNTIVVCNITAPASQAARVRRMVPALLSTLSINDERMAGAELDALPDPLIFPVYDPSATQVPAQVVGGG